MDSTFTLITGAGSGFGKALTLELAKRGKNVFLVSLKGEGLDVLCREITMKYKVEAHYSETDLTEREELMELIEKIKEKYKIDTLINNAGIGGSIEFEKVDLFKIEKMILLNITAMTILTHQLLPELKKNKQAYILNVSSIASFCPIAYKSIYPASKAFISYFSKGLSQELRDSNVFVSVVSPGPMKTNEIQVKRIAKYGILGRLGWMSAERVASKAIQNLYEHKREILVGNLNYLMQIFLNFLPERIKLPLLSNFVKKELGL